MSETNRSHLPNPITRILTEEDERVLILCALRFDGWQYLRAIGEPDNDFRPLVEPVVETQQLHSEESNNFAAFFALQRYLHKWGGEMEPDESPVRQAFYHLFLHMYRRPVPDAFRSDEYANPWSELSDERIEKVAGTVRQALRVHPIESWQWGHLNRMQLGCYGEYVAKLAFARHGFEVFTPEVDDRGVDFAIRRDGRFYRVQGEVRHPWKSQSIHL